jgi:hypothetical protein
MIDPATAQVVEHIHDTPPRLVLEFAGAGSLALYWLHAVAGSSRTVLEATDRYASSSLVDLLDETPEQFVSAATAEEMAARGFERALLLADDATPLLGVACTATITTDRAKRGEHRCHVAVRDAASVSVYSLTLTKGLRDRLGEESLVSLLILRAIAEACGVEPPALPLDSTERVEVARHAPEDPLARLLAPAPDATAPRTVAVLRDGRRLADAPFAGALLSGSFNPLHIGHEQLLAAAGAFLQLPTAFELPVVNADKASLSYEDALRRLAQFHRRAPVLLSSEPLFVGKASLYPGCVFVVGYDTAERLLAPRYYGDSAAQMAAALEQIRAAGCRFLVAGRLAADGRFHTLAELPVPPALRDLFIELPASHFRVDLSSTALRAQGLTLG